MDPKFQDDFKQLGKLQIVALRAEIQSALDSIKTRYNLKELSLGPINYSMVAFNAKITGKVQNEIAISIEQDEAEFFARQNGLPLDFLGAKFMLDGDVYKIKELVVKRPKYPILGHCEEKGKYLKFTTQSIKHYLEKHRVIDIGYSDVDRGRLGE